MNPYIKAIADRVDIARSYRVALKPPPVRPMVLGRLKSIKRTGPKPATAKQYQRWLESHRGWGTQLEADGGCKAEDAVHDFVQGLFDFPDQQTERMIAYLEESGPYAKEMLADALYAVAYD